MNNRAKKCAPAGDKQAESIDGQVALSGIPVSSNGTVTARRIYRTKAGTGSLFYLLATLLVVLVLTLKNEWSVDPRSVIQASPAALVEKSAVPKPVHFAALTTQQQIELAARDPRYGRIACRCEQVTEGEVADAIHRGARTLDGIKFRTRAGMGRCQGGFCTARCMELLSRELGVPFTAITKRGGTSWVVCARDDEGAV